MTMAMAEPRRMATARILYDTVTEYIDGNRHSRDVNERWLCATLEPFLVRISGVMNSRPTIADLPAIAAFRAAEIEKQVSDKRSELARLERDLAIAQKELQPVDPQ
jgi:hypothetical protein